jgi:hypothetical protein
MVEYIVPGMKSVTAERVIKLPQDRLNSLSDLALALALKHVHCPYQASEHNTMAHAAPRPTASWPPP